MWQASRASGRHERRERGIGQETRRKLPHTRVSVEWLEVVEMERCAQW